MKRQHQFHEEGDETPWLTEAITTDGLRSYGAAEEQAALAFSQAKAGVPAR